jgi:hypothetical protein
MMSHSNTMKIQAIALLACLLTAVCAKAETLLFQISGTVGDNTGSSVANAGDVNADGIDDIIFGAPYNDTVGSQAGMAQVVSGRDGSLLHTLYGSNQASEFFGQVVLGAGDLNQDGYSDLLVSGEYDNGADNDPNKDWGRIYAFSGRTGVRLYTITGSRYLGRLGKALAVIGDINSDNVPDFIAGEPNGGAARNGVAHVYSGSTGVRLFQIQELLADDFGSAVSGIGDINADGTPDFAVGAPYSNTLTGDFKGSAHLYSGRTGARIATLFGRSARVKFGASITNAGDINADGYPDIAIGASGFGFGQVDYKPGYVEIFSGQNRSSLRMLVGSQDNERFGEMLEPMGDLNNDGVDDLAIGGIAYSSDGLSVRGRVQIFSGVDGTVLHTQLGTMPHAMLGLAGAAVDLNGDGLAELVLHARTDDTLSAELTAYRLAARFQSTIEASVTNHGTLTLTTAHALGNIACDYRIRVAKSVAALAAGRGKIVREFSGDNMVEKIFTVENLRRLQAPLTELAFGLDANCDDTGYRLSDTASVNTATIRGEARRRSLGQVARMIARRMQ